PSLPEAPGTSTQTASVNHCKQFGESLQIGDGHEQQPAERAAEMRVVVDASPLLQRSPVGIADVSDGEDHGGDWYRNGKNDQLCSREVNDVGEQHGRDRAGRPE